MANRASSAGQFTFPGQPPADPSKAVSILRAVGAVTDVLGIDFGTKIAPLTASDRPPPRAVAGLDVRQTEFAHQSVWAIGSDNPSGEYVIALHGGAYVVQPTTIHWSAYAAMVRHTNATVVVPIYPLASTPEGRARRVVPDMADLIADYISQHGANHVSLYGDSAGGGMALASAQLLLRRGDQTPKGIVLVSPWLDVTMSNPVIDLIDDPILRKASLLRDGRKWAGDLPLTDPLVSPIYGSLAGLPPTALYSGSLDLLAADALLLQEKAQAISANNLTFVLRNGEIHDWALRGASRAHEPDRTQRKIYQQLGIAALTP